MERLYLSLTNAFSLLWKDHDDVHSIVLVDQLIRGRFLMKMRLSDREYWSSSVSANIHFTHRLMASEHGLSRMRIQFWYLNWCNGIATHWFKRWRNVSDSNDSASCWRKKWFFSNLLLQLIFREFKHQHWFK